MADEGFVASKLCFAFGAVAVVQRAAVGGILLYFAMGLVVGLKALRRWDAHFMHLCSEHCDVEFSEHISYFFVGENLDARRSGFPSRSIYRVLANSSRSCRIMCAHGVDCSFVVPSSFILLIPFLSSILVVP